MGGSLLAVAVLAIMALASAVDEECVQRKLRNLPVHWPNPTDCSVFYRCTNKNIKRELHCPEGKEYNPKSGRCANQGKNLCKLSLLAPLTGSTNPCADEISGTFVAHAESCRSFNICYNNSAYPQICDLGSYFNADVAACEPDIDKLCWENLCVKMANGANVANVNNCSSFYICYDEKAVAQNCPDGSYFDAESLNCQPGKCPSEIVTTTCAPETTTPANDDDCANANCDATECENAPDDFTFPATNTNTAYCVCINQKPQYRECSGDAIFDESLKVCVDPDKVCPSSNCCDKPDYTTFPASNTTAGYCRCLNGEATYHDCADKDFIYDPELGICVKSSNDDDCDNETTKLCAGGYKEGDFVHNPNSCMSLYVCFNGELIDISCGPGNYYDDKIKVCLPDEEGKCPESHQIQSTHNERTKRDIQKYPSPSCNTYYKSCNNVRLLYGCGKGKFFNITSFECEYDFDSVCIDTIPCDTGTKIATNCTAYYECCTGKFWKKQCDENYYFDNITKSCQFDSENVCKPCLCPGGYENGEMTIDPNDCNKFYICVDGTMVWQECGKGNYFNSTTNTCELDVHKVCQKSCGCPGGYQQGELSPHPTDCDKFYICHNTKQILQECGNGNYFNSTTLTCEPDLYQECWPKPACTCPGGYEEGQFSAHPTQCNKYYICHGGRQMLQDCGIDNYFNVETSVCEPDTYNVCWPNLCATAADGEMIANPKQCNAFYLCKDGVGTPHTCDEGEYFDGICKIDLDAKCYNPCPSENRIFTLPHPLCNKYYLCNKGIVFVQECSANTYYNTETRVCDANVTCEIKTCVGNETEPHPHNDDQYYTCQDGIEILRNCSSNHIFDKDLKICVQLTDPKCPPCHSEEVTATLPLNSTDSAEYCICYNKIAYLKRCDEGYVFNTLSRSCFSNASCDPNFCRTKDDFTLAPNRNCNRSFCMCMNHTAVIVNCPNDYTFNPYALKCTDRKMSPECSQEWCVTNGTYTTYHTEKDLNGFCLCDDQIGTFIPCTYGTQYDKHLGICRRKEISCNSNLCKDLPNNALLPALTTNNGYCQCIDGTAIYKPCKPPEVFSCTNGRCQQPRCPSESTVVGSFPAFEANGLCICQNGLCNYTECPEGKLPSELTNICMNPCPYPCPTDGSPTNSPISSNSFCECTNGTPEYTKCKEAYIFNGTECVPDDNILCPECSDTVSPSNQTNEGFCEKIGSDCKFVPCEDDEYFNGFICYPKATAICNLNRCKYATIDEPVAFPLKSTTLFCYCTSSTDVMVMECPDDLIFNEHLGMCVHNQDVVTFVCPDNTRPGQKFADPLSCNKYYECYNGNAALNACDQNYYFDVNQNFCLRDNDGICNKRQFSCLNDYYDGERLPHPVNPYTYYVCEDDKLIEHHCPDNLVFSNYQKQCVQRRSLPLYNDLPQKRSADLTTNDHEFGCVDNEKRSVPSNCSQYEICINQVWKRRTCTNYRYYNPEQRKCLEPRDDFVCLYAKLTTLPTCNASIEYKLHPAKSCQQYYRCEGDKWRLKSCGRQQYFDMKLSTCLLMPLDGRFQCESVKNEAIINVVNEQETTTCEHLSQRFYGKNCAMYLICLDNEWWYQYCPAGMYFNRSHNYCVPDVQQQCADVIKLQVNMNAEEFSQEVCEQDGLLRPSALACNRYFVCLNGKWQMQHCSQEEFYDVANVKCSPDTDGQCTQLNMDCLMNEKRAVPRNCSLYEQCSADGKWLKMTCPQGEIFDELLQQCMANQNICSIYGLKRTCRANEKLPITHNCSMFYYCSSDSWNLGSCLKGFMYSTDELKCIPHAPNDTCKPFRLGDSNISLMEFTSDTELCQDKPDGAWIAHPSDCSRYYICLQQSISQEMQCSRGSYFEASLGYCRPNDGSCRLPLTGPCMNATDGTLIPHPTDCQAFYKCSTINGTELSYCPEGQFYHNYTHQCRIDHGECKREFAKTAKCSGLAHGTRLAHESYCNIYYACVKGLAIPIECPDNYQFNAILGKCILDEEKQCQNGQLINGNTTYSCGGMPDGSYLPDRRDCTRYYICSQGQPLPKKCASSTYFDSELLLCVPDDGSCPFVDDDDGQHNPSIPDPTVCEGKHGYLMTDPFNCNNFYACVHNKLKHERCYPQQFFNTTIQQCQQIVPHESGTNDNITMADSIINEMVFTTRNQLCLDDTTSITKLCSEMTVGTSLAEPGDCRRYITCQEGNEEPLSQRCRNGESFDSLLGFCRQNDGTCLLENGQRVGECSGKHGQLARDSNSCRNYFVCINGQKIAQTCNSDEYFSKTENVCVKDTLQTCNPTQPLEDQIKQSCAGLSESVLYPYIHDNCRSYFQCIKGIAKIHKCADDLYFDPLTIKCVQNKTECVMPAQTLQRSPAFSQTFNKLCKTKSLELPYANLDNDCRSFYICHANGEISHELCPLGMMFNKELNICTAENKAICKINTSAGD